MGNNKKNIDKPKSKAEYVGAIFFSLIFAYIINTLPSWVNWVADGYTAVVWTFNLSIFITVTTSLVLIFANFRILSAIFQIIQNIFSLAAIVTFYYIFPIYATPTIEMLIRVISIIVIIGVIIGTVAEFFKLFRIKS